MKTLLILILLAWTTGSLAQEEAQVKAPAEVQAEALTANAPTSPTDFMIQLKSYLLDLNNESIELKEKEHHICSQIEDALDLPFMARYAAGKYWKKITQEQKERFSFLFRQTIFQKIKSVAGKLRNDDQLKITGEKIQTSNLHYIVSSVAVDPNGSKINLSWRIKKNSSGNYKIVDVTVEGVSLIINARQEYRSIIRSHGGFQEFLGVLEEKLSSSETHLCLPEPETLPTPA